MTAVRGDDRVADVLARDDGLIAVFEDVSPAFRRLRNPGLRKVMARLVTITQAARVAGVDEDELLRRLNAAVETGAPGRGHGPAPSTQGAGGRGESQGEREAGDMATEQRDMPAELAMIPSDRVVELDVRDDLRDGKEPFSRIMQARSEVPDGGALMLRAIFEPAPLYAVLGKQGWRHWTEQRGEEDWVVWFYRGAKTGDSGSESERAGQAEGETEGVVVLDVRGLEPPEPMVRTLAALETLPRGETLVQINVREPRFLLPQLAERGFEYEVREQAEDLVRIFIRHREE